MSDFANNGELSAGIEAEVDAATHAALRVAWRRFLQSSKRQLGVSFCLAALFSTGCTPFGEYVRNGFKVGPEYCKPVAPVAEHWIDANDKGIVSDPTDDANWWNAFNDPVLNGLVNEAYSQNLTLREAGFRVLQARAQRNIAIGNIFPQDQAAVGSYTRRALSTQVANRQFIAESFYGQYDLGFSQAWELDFWGRFRRAIESAQAELDASVEEYDQVLVTLLGDVAQTYVEIRILERRIDLANANITLQTTTYEIAKGRYEGQAVSEVDVNQAQSDLNSTQALVPSLEIQRRQAMNRLCVLLGIPTVDLQERLAKGPIPAAPAEVVVGVPADLLSRRPDVRQAERLAAAQSALIGVAESNLYPIVTITGNIGYSAQDFEDLFTSNGFFGNIGPGFQWNILNYGRLVNNVRLQDAKFQEAVANYQNTVLQANREVEDGLVQFLKAQVEVKFLIVSAAAANQAVQEAIAQYDGGLVDFNRVALLQERLVQRQEELAIAQGDVALGLVQVYRALGGGWQIRLADESSVLATAIPVDGAIEPTPIEAKTATPSTPATKKPPAPSAQPTPVKPGAAEPVKPGAAEPEKAEPKTPAQKPTADAAKPTP